MSDLDGMAAYADAITNPRRDDPNWPLPSFNAREWAEAFCRSAAENGHPGIDPAWMQTWFANALMRGFDEACVRLSPPPPSEAYRAGINAAAVELRRQAREMRQRAKGCTYAINAAATLETAADSLAELPKPQPVERRP